MEKGPIIVNLPETPKSPYLYLLQELQGDIMAFPSHIQPLVEKVLSGQHLGSDEQSVFSKAQNKWWSDKYGFPFSNARARDEVLVKKYNPKLDGEAHKFQKELLEAIQIGDEGKIMDLKKKYQEAYPNQMESIEVIFGIRDFLEKSKTLNADNHKKRRYKQLNHEETMSLVRDLTEYQFLFTHFIIQNNKDREYLDIFWKVGEAMASKINSSREFNILRRAQMSQVAVYRILEEIGDNPKIAHPDEDAFKAIDMWEDSQKPIQIKGWREEVPAVFSSNEISFPAMQVDDEGKIKSKLYGSVEYMKSHDIKFRAKLKKYGEKLGKELTGYMLAIPYSKIDFVNGEPALELIEFFKEHLKKELTQNPEDSEKVEAWEDEGGSTK